MRKIIKNISIVIVCLITLYLLRNKIYGSEVKYSEYYNGWYVQVNFIFLTSYIAYNPVTKDIESERPVLNHYEIYTTKAKALEAQEAWRKH